MNNHFCFEMSLHCRIHLFFLFLHHSIMNFDYICKVFKTISEPNPLILKYMFNCLCFTSSKRCTSRHYQFKEQITFRSHFCFVMIHFYLSQKIILTYLYLFTITYSTSNNLYMNDCVLLRKST